MCINIIHCNYSYISTSSGNPLQSLGLQARVLRHINDLILQLRDQTLSQFESTGLSSAFPALSDSDEKRHYSIIPRYHNTMSINGYRKQVEISPLHILGARPPSPRIDANNLLGFSYNLSITGNEGKNLYFEDPENKTVNSRIRQRVTFTATADSFVLSSVHM